ncbi:YbaK/EbsC protein [Aeromicrobium marinum DSM 15272]|uniref:YbaK/EbsC protein n=1 Tax=Aeromicrobium marinum DSM 15272 TaxID=585531 RepID=E2S945_9ACTN|nr:YbaK/EbsC protein [Aeromicrobium marinum DSM 15272]
MDFVLHTYAHDPRATSYGLEAARALQVEPDRVFKTLVVALDSSRAVGVVPVSRSLDLKALAAALGSKKAQLADPVDAERVTGFVTGGISPVGQKRRLPTVLDESLQQWDTIFVSGGRRGLDVEVSADDLVRLTDGVLAAIAR